MIHAIVFDADDTLWLTEQLYDHALDRAQHLMDKSGVDGYTWRRLQREIDLDAVHHAGFSTDRFPTSSVKAYRKLAKVIDPTIEKELFSISAGVFAEKAPLVPDVEPTLCLLQQQYRLAAITKGDAAVQHSRMNASGLRDYFEVFAIVEQKKPETYAGICDIMALPPSSVVSVGNSIRSDLLPALHAGLHGVWIDAYVWAHEAHTTGEPPKGIWTAHHIRELPELIHSLAKELD